MCGVPFWCALVQGRYPLVLVLTLGHAPDGLDADAEKIIIRLM